MPNAGSQNQHIDGSFAPSSSRDLISNINNEAYTRMDNDASAKSIGFDLIFGYMQNNTFNVNTYMADIRQTPANSGNQSAESAYAAYKNYQSLDKKSNHKLMRIIFGRLNPLLALMQKMLNQHQKISI